MKVIDIITERQDVPQGNMTLTIFDIDDTLFHTTAKINVMKDGRVVRSLTNQEFNNYELQPGEKYDFGEFRSAEKFAKESEPIKPMINTLKRILNRASNTKVIMLTARADFDDKDKFLNTFGKYGIDMSRVHVHRAGNLPGDEAPAYKKAVYVRKYLSTGKYNRVNLIDDSMTNLKVFKNLKSEFPNVNFDAYFVKPEGSLVVVESWINEKLDSYGNVKGDPIGDVIANIQKKKTTAPINTKPATVKTQKSQAAQPAPITGNPLEQTLRNVALQAGIKGKELAQFLAQCAHETMNYASLVEFGDGKDYDPKINPQKAKTLGNTVPGDGALFKGRGFIQLTGRYNYSQAGQALGIPLEQKPQLLEKPEIAAKASVWFWNNRVKPNVKNFTDTRTVTGYINPGLRGLQKRHGLFQTYLQTMTPTGKVKEEKSTEDYHPNDPPPGPETKPTMPAGTVRVDVSDVYDWYKLGQHISNLKGLGKHDFGKGPPSTILSFGSEEEEHKYIQDLMKLGLATTDIDPASHKKIKGQKVDPTYKVDEDSIGSVIYTKPNLENEWEEAARYPEFVRIGKEDWIKLAQAGRAVTIKSAKDINNTDAADPNSFKLLNKDKQARALSQIKQGSVEMPIVAVYSDGRKELIGGNTRLTATLAKFGKSTVWAFKVPDEVSRLAENFADGRNPQDKGDSARHGIPKKASISALKKIRSSKSASPRKKQLAHWQINMRQGRNK